MNADPPESQTDRKIRAEMVAIWAAPQKRTRRSTPLEFRNPSGRLALSLWREQAFFSEASGRYENWWGLVLDTGTKAKIDNAVAGFSSYEAFQAAYWRHRRPNAVRFEGNSVGARFDELRDQLPQVDFEQFLSAMSEPVAARKAYAEDFGIRVTRVLKEYLEVPSHRPKVKQSKADLVDDKWMRRLAAYVLNFPENFC